MEDLSLSKEEDEGFILDDSSFSEGDSEVRLCLVGRFLTDRPINFSAMKNRMAGIWRPGKGICIKEIDSNLYLFQFFHAVDLNRVLSGGPWSFDNHLLIIHKMKTGDIPMHVPLFFVDFWVQVYNLPIGFMSENVGRLLGNFVGKFIEYDANNNSSIWRTYMRLRVNLDVRQPLKRFKKIKKQGGDWAVVSFKYERLSSFCFICGLLGHTDRFCDKLFTIAEEDVKREWGPWLCAPAKKPNMSGGERWLREEGRAFDSSSTYTDVMQMSGDVREGENSNAEDNLGNVTGENSSAVTNFKNKHHDQIPNKLANFQGLPSTNSIHNSSPQSEEMILEINEERKRRRGPGLSFSQQKNMDLDISTQSKEAQIHEKTSEDHLNHFLLAGSGLQACQSP